MGLMEAPAPIALAKSAPIVKAWADGDIFYWGCAAY